MAALFLVACAPPNAAMDTERAIAESTQALNQGEFSKAVDILEPAYMANPASSELQNKLMHAHAGASGFNAMTFYRFLKGGGQNENSVREALREISPLDEGKRAHLSRAIEIFEASQLAVSERSQKDNLKWGVLYLYRALGDIKLLSDSPPGSLSTQQEIAAMSSILKDIYRTYLLFKSSYAKIQVIANRLDDTLRKIKDECTDAGIVIPKNEETFEQFLKKFLENNQDLVSAKVSRRISEKAPKFNLRIFMKKSDASLFDANDECKILAKETLQVIKSATDRAPNLERKIELTGLNALKRTQDVLLNALLTGDAGELELWWEEVSSANIKAL